MCGAERCRWAVPGTWPCRVPELLPAGAGQCRGWRPILCTVVSCAGTEPVLLWVEAGAEMAFPANTGGQLWFLLRHLSHLNPRVSLRALLSALSFLHTHLPTTHLGCLQVLCFFPSNSPPRSTCQSRRHPLPFSFQSPPATPLCSPNHRVIFMRGPEPGTSLAPLHISLPLLMHHLVEKRLC